jgi:hypothetical protein
MNLVDQVPHTDLEPSSLVQDFEAKYLASGRSLKFLNLSNETR